MHNRSISAVIAAATSAVLAVSIASCGNDEPELSTVAGGEDRSQPTAEQSDDETEDQEAPLERVQPNHESTTPATYDLESPADEYRITYINGLIEFEQPDDAPILYQLGYRVEEPDENGDYPLVTANLDRYDQDGDEYTESEIGGAVAYRVEREGTEDHGFDGHGSGTELRYILSQGDVTIIQSAFAPEGTAFSDADRDAVDQMAQSIEIDESALVGTPDDGGPVEPVVPFSYERLEGLEGGDIAREARSFDVEYVYGDVPVEVSIDFHPDEQTAAEAVAAHEENYRDIGANTVDVTQDPNVADGVGGRIDQGYGWINQVDGEARHHVFELRVGTTTILFYAGNGDAAMPDDASDAVMSAFTSLTIG